MRVGLVLQAEPPQHLLHALGDLVGADVSQPQPVRELVEHGVRDELVLGVLEDEADVRGEVAR
nr:hypothetical protein [Microbacterium sp. NIBRBAC000506063]